MKYQKLYFKNLNAIRLVACLAILFYHLNLLKGGYLAVCIFFVLSSYLACTQAFKQNKFSFKDYYFNKFKKLYIPLLMVVLITVGILTFFPAINWLNLKPETTSVLFGYNNFWQIKANLDYFARNIDSPFMHFWYISILLQFDLIFPFLFLLFKKIGDKIKKWLSCGILGGLTIISFAYFIFSIYTEKVMFSYYGTLTRSFALFFGMFLGFFHHYYKPLTFKKFQQGIWNKLIFYIYLIILIGLFGYLDNNACLMIAGMAITTILTGRLISYAVVNNEKEMTKYDNCMAIAASVTYEVYLWQYPVIFITQLLNIDLFIKIVIVIGGTIILAIWLHYCLEKKKQQNLLKMIKVGLLIPLIIMSVYGGVQYCLAEDHTEEMKKLERQLQLNEQLIKQKQEEFAAKFKQDEENWLAKLENLENGEKEIANIVNNLSIVGVGDSVMLGAVPNLYEQFPNGYFDAAISRTAWVAGGILKDLQTKDLLGDIVVLNLGANGDCSKDCKDEIMNIIKNKKVYWVNIKNNENLHFNEKIEEYAKNYPNLEVIDWYSISENHPEYFVADGIHLTETGREAYTKAIYDSIYNTYLTEYKQQVQNIIDNHEKEEKNKISFYGNELLVNAYETLKDDFAEASFVAEKEINYDDLYQKIKQEINDKSLMYNVVLLLDSNFMMNKEEYAELVSLCQDRILYIVTLNEEVENIISDGRYSNVKLINFNEQLKNHEDYLMADKIHLSIKGNEKLKDVLLANFK